MLWLLLVLMSSGYTEEWKNPFYYRSDDTASMLINERVSGSHIKVFLPTMPYLYVSKLVNGTLVRSSGNRQGWEYMMATSYTKIDDLTYEFSLRKGVLFQDGTPFNADSVVENFDYFMKDPVVYSDIQKDSKALPKSMNIPFAFIYISHMGFFLVTLPLSIFIHLLTSNVMFGVRKRALRVIVCKRLVLTG